MEDSTRNLIVILTSSFGGLILFNALIGLIAFEYAWANTKTYRNPIEELDEKFPAFRRTDAKKWVKCHFYCGAVTLLVPRLLSIVVNLLLLTLAVKILLIGQKRDSQLSGCRYKCLRFWYKLYVHCINIFGLFTILKYRYLTQDDVDYYQDYVGNALKRKMTRRNTLGKKIDQSDSQTEILRDIAGGLIVEADTHHISEDEEEGNEEMKVPKRGPGRCAVIVCNHIGWPEVCNFICSPIFPGFTPMKEIIQMPLAGTLAIGLQSLFVSRGADATTREKVV